jgi:hypothetical protein
MVSKFVAAVRESNRQLQDGWERYTPHRERVTAVLSEYAGPGASLCILGAGNLNDVRLDHLLSSFAKIHLVDLDVDSVTSALMRQRLNSRSGLCVHGPIDLSGILDRLPTRASGAPAVTHDLVGMLVGNRCAVAGQPFDVTASTGVLTQLIQSVADAALAPDDLVRVSLALRDKHLADLVHLTRPGGALVLVSDVVSTYTAPELSEAAAHDLERLLSVCIAAKNFFTGTNPYRILDLLQTSFRDSVTDIRLVDPWLWAVAPDRQHLTYAIVARRRRDVHQSTAAASPSPFRAPPLRP